MEVDGQDLACSQDILTRLMMQKGSGNEGATFKTYLEGLSYPPICDFPQGCLTLESLANIFCVPKISRFGMV